jgi:hypothetical protein
VSENLPGETSWSWRRDEVAGTAARVAGLISALPSVDLPLRRVRRTAGETAGHLISLPPRYRAMIDGSHPLPEPPAAANEEALDAVPERDPAALADRLTEEVTRLLGARAGRRAAGLVLHRRAHRGGLSAIMLSERRADFHLNVDPVACQQISFGHLSDTKAALTGKAFAYGRKPWVATRFAKAFAET